MNHDLDPLKINDLWILILISDQDSDLSLIRSCLPETVIDLNLQKLHYILAGQPSATATGLGPSTMLHSSVPVEIVLGWRSPETCHGLLQKIFTSAQFRNQYSTQNRSSTQPSDRVSADSNPACYITLLIKVSDRSLTKSAWLNPILDQYPDVSFIDLIAPNSESRVTPSTQEIHSLLPDYFESNDAMSSASQWVDTLPWESLQRADGSLLLTRALRLAWQQMRSRPPYTTDDPVNAPTSALFPNIQNIQNLPTLLFLATLSALDSLPWNFPEFTNQESQSDSLAILQKYLRSDQQKSNQQEFNQRRFSQQESNQQEFQIYSSHRLSNQSRYQKYIHQLCQLLEQAPDGCLMIDNQGIVWYANPSAIRLLNRDLDVIVGHHIGLPIVTNQVTEIELIGRHGELHTAEMSVVPVTWNHGQGYAVVMRDISKHRQVEAQLEYRLNLETALSNISRMLATTDATLLEPILEQVGHTTRVNRALLFWRSQPTVDRLQLACEWHSRTTPRLHDRLRSPSANLWSTWHPILTSGRDVMISCPEDWSDASSTECEWLQSLHLATALLSPIRDHHGQLIGVLLVGTQLQHPVRRWIDADRQLLQLVGQGLCAYQERQQVQNELRASEALYASIFNHSAEYIFLIKVTPEGDFIFETINPAFEAAIGKAVREIQGKKIEEVFDQSYAQTSIARYRACVAGRSKITYEENIFLEGKTRIWRTGLVPIFDNWNQVDRLQGSSRDITSEYQFLDQQQQQRRYLQLLASLSLKIRKALTFNDILSLTVGELQRTLKTSRVFFVEIFPDGMGQIRGDTYQLQNQYLQSNQVEIHDLTANLIQYMNGNVLIQNRSDLSSMQWRQTSQSVQDSDQSNLIQEKFSDSQDRSARLQEIHDQETYDQETSNELLDSSAGNSVLWMHQPMVRPVSQSAVSWMMPQSQLIVPVLISRSAAQTINRGYVPPSPPNHETHHEQDSGLIGLLGLQEFEESRVWTSFEQELLRQLATQLGLALHQAQLLEERADYIEKLARSNEDLEQFAYVVSHDLQEPLRGAIGFSELLLEDYGNQIDEVGHEYIQFILDSSLRMRQLIRDLLTLSRVGTHGHILKNTNCNLVLEDVLHNLHVAIEESEAEIIVPPLPVVWGDHLQLVQLFQNLLGNALKFRSDRPPRIEIRVSQHHDDQWLFSVSDNGIGFDQRHEERIFQVFQRLHDRETYDGTGMGLTICRKIVERHHGSIWVESRLNQGSTFYVTFLMGQDVEI